VPHGLRSDRPHFHVRFEFSFLYIVGQLCACVALLEGIILHGFFLQAVCFLDRGETFENEQSVSCSNSDIKNLRNAQSGSYRSVYFVRRICVHPSVCRVLQPIVGQLKADGYIMKFGCLGVL
jgi:hypothetical protein